MHRHLIIFAILLLATAAQADVYNQGPQQGYPQGYDQGQVQQQVPPAYYPPQEQQYSNDPQYPDPTGGAQVQEGQGNIQIGNNNTIIIQVDPQGGVRQTMLADAYNNDEAYGSVLAEQVPYTPVNPNLIVNSWTPGVPYGWVCPPYGQSNLGNYHGQGSYVYWGPRQQQRFDLFNVYADPRGYRYFVYNRYAQQRRHVPRGFYNVPPRPSHPQYQPRHVPFAAFGLPPQSNLAPHLMNPGLAPGMHPGGHFRNQPPRHGVPRHHIGPRGHGPGWAPGYQPQHPRHQHPGHRGGGPNFHYPRG